MKTAKRIISVFTAVALASVCLCGCSGKDDGSDGGKTGGSEIVTEPGEIRDMTAQELVVDMGFGWNLGNTLDVCQADRDGDGVVNEHVDEGEKVDETLWGNPPATKELFEALKESGIKSVRIPVTWRDHMDENYKVDEEWMNRVEEVVGYAYDLDMYVILNIHHDGGGDPQFGAWISNAQDDKEETMKKYVTLWEQICERFKNYSDLLVFESMNEVGFDRISEDDAYALLNEFNQTFVDTVRASGGNNEKRHLLIAGYWTDIVKTCDGRYSMPADTIDDRLILSIHYYTPWEFCTTNINYTWGTTDEVNQMKNLFGRLKETYVDKGVPVIIGEYGVGGNEFSSCIYFIENVCKLCHDYQMAPFFWDNGAIFNRYTYEWGGATEYIDAMKRAFSGEDYEVTKLDV